MGRENRRETIKSNSWKLSLHVRPTFFYALLLYIYIGFVQFFALNKREKFVPRTNGTSTPWKWKFSQRRGKPICSECNILQLYIYIYPFLYSRFFEDTRFDQLANQFEMHLYSATVCLPRTFIRIPFQDRADPTENSRNIQQERNKGVGLT